MQQWFLLAAAGSEMEAHRGEALLLAGDACWTFPGLAAKGAYRQLGGASDAMDRLASSSACEL